MKGLKNVMLNLYLESMGRLNVFTSYYNDEVSLPVVNKIFCFLYGYTLNRYELYDLKIKKNARRYLPDCKQMKMGYINRPYDVIINDKALFYQFMSGTGLSSKLYGYIKDKEIVIKSEKRDEKALSDMVKDKKKLIIKRSSDGGGKGVFLLRYDNHQLYLDDEPIEMKQVVENKLEAGMKYLITEWLDNGEYCKHIYDGCTNSLRFISIRDVETKEVHIVSVYHKFGMIGTKAADNCQAGGLCYDVDLKTGVIGGGFVQKGGKTIWLDYHPDTKEKVAGVKIPNWDTVLSEVRKLHSMMPFIEYVGWDIIVYENGIKVIEGNNNSGLGVQFNRPFKEDKKMKKFLKYHDIIL